MLGLLFTLLITIIIPIILFIYAIKQKNTKAFIVGVLAFVISQLLLRMPLIEYLSATSTQFTLIQTTNPILFSIALGLSAGLFEEITRYIMMRFILRKRTWQMGFFFGAGHGAIEAFLLVGMHMIVFWYTKDYLLQPSFMTAFAGVERIFAMLLHIGLSIIVLQAVMERKIIYLLIAIMIHGMIDALIGILPVYFSPLTAFTLIEVALACVALTVFIYGLSIRKRGVFDEKNLSI